MKYFGSKAVVYPLFQKTAYRKDSRNSTKKSPNRVVELLIVSETTILVELQTVENSTLKCLRKEKKNLGKFYQKRTKSALHREILL